MSNSPDTSATPVVAVDDVTIGVDPDNLRAGVLLDSDGRVVAEGVDVRVDSEGTLVGDDDTDSATDGPTVSDESTSLNIPHDQRTWTDDDG
jgi:hypothetical protein